MYQDLQSSFTKNFNSSADNSAQSVVGTAATPILSNNVLDMGTPANVKRNSLGDNTQKYDFSASCIPFHVQVVEDLTGATGGVTVEVIQSDVAAMTSPDVLFTKTIPAADFKVGHAVKVKDLPMGITKRYVAVRFTPLTTNSTAGAVEAFIPTAKDLP